MVDIVWRENSRKMYDAILTGTPVVFRGLVKKNIADWINKNNITVVTEALVFKAVDEIAPETLANTIKPELEKLKST